MTQEHNMKRINPHLDAVLAASHAINRAKFLLDGLHIPSLDQTLGCQQMTEAKKLLDKLAEKRKAVALN